MPLKPSSRPALNALTGLTSLTFLTSSTFWTVWILILPFFSPLAAAAQRLPQGARPESYALHLTPNLQTATFAGEETIDITLAQPVNAVTLNAIEIKFDRVTAEAAGKTFAAKVSLDPDKQQATFHFSETLPAGPASLKMKYTGILNNELRGFYLSKTSKRNYAVTQFEATDARRAFPCFDEPALKATFNVSLTISKGDTAISNTNIVSDAPGPLAGEHTLRFARTPKMSTYLVAFLVGDFQCLSGKSDGVPVRACATPGHLQDGAFALSAAEFFLHYYDVYFGIKYPLPKLDMIALPDFEAGAMENFGAITYRETALLVNPQTASVADEKLVAVDVAHEMAHQWFGDLVTMNWWNNVWLNEGFATWMENKAVAAWKPEWEMPQDVASTLNATLNLDAQRITRTIRATADTPDQINQMFDGITYGKAGAVLLMVEHYIGEQTFREGVQKYLRAHLYANATAEDFWNAQTAVSHKPVDKIMDSLVSQPGEPLLTFGAARDGKVEAAQQRFFLNSKVTASPGLLWTLPVCMKSGGETGDCQILNSPTATLNVPQAPVFYGNAGGRGYYRALYDSGDYKELIARVESALDPVERITLLGNEWALTQADKATVADFMNLASAVKDDPSPYVIGTVVSAVAAIDQRLAATPQEHELLARWVRKSFTAAFDRLGAPNAKDAPEKRELRGELFALLGGIGGEPRIVSQAKQIAERYLEDPASVDATLGEAALQVAAQNGDSAFFDRLQTVSETTNNPQLYSETLFALARFRDPALVDRAMEYAVSGKVRNQDSIRFVIFELRNRFTRDRAWQFVQARWPKVQAQITTLEGGSLVQSTGSFCSAERRGEVTQFFTKHKVPAAGNDLQRAQDSINDCVEFRATQGANLQRWLAHAS